MLVCPSAQKTTAQKQIVLRKDKEKEKEKEKGKGKRGKGKTQRKRERKTQYPAAIPAGLHCHCISAGVAMADRAAAAGLGASCSSYQICICLLKRGCRPCRRRRCGSRSHVCSSFEFWCAALFQASSAPLGLPHARVFYCVSEEVRERAGTLALDLTRSMFASILCFQPWLRPWKGKRKVEEAQDLWRRGFERQEIVFVSEVCVLIRSYQLGKDVAEAMEL